MTKCLWPAAMAWHAAGRRLGRRAAGRGCPRLIDRGTAAREAACSTARHASRAASGWRSGWRGVPLAGWRGGRERLGDEFCDQLQVHAVCARSLWRTPKCIGWAAFVVWGANPLWSIQSERNNTPQLPSAVQPCLPSLQRCCCCWSAAWVRPRQLPLPGMALNATGHVAGMCGLRCSR